MITSQPPDVTIWPKALAELFDPRIVNGEEAEPHQFPYQCALFIDGGSFCGCSVVEVKTILTAAHCADGARSIEVVAAAHNIQQDEDTQQSITSTNFVVHEDWDPSKIANDIAIIILPEALNLDGKTVAPLKLYDGDSDLVRQQATVSGWGRPSDSSGSISPVLRHTSDLIFSNTVCNFYYGTVKSTNICLDGSSKRSSCNGDCGGPLVVTVNGEVQEVGIVSFGSAFGCESGFPSVYTRVSAFTSWIAENRASL